MSSEAGILSLSWEQAASLRLARHGLLPGPDPRGTARTPASVVARMCGAHAQVMAAAEWSIGVRLPGATSAGIQAALRAERSLVKTFGPRGTVHLLPAADLPLWVAALSAIPQPPRNMISTYLTPPQVESVLAAVDLAVRSEELTIDELTEAVVAACGAWAGEPVVPAFGGWWPRWRQVLSLAGIRGVLCFGTGRGRNVTFTSVRRLVPDFEPADSQPALDWLVSEFLLAYGPATSDQFAQWLYAPRSWAAELFTRLAPRLQLTELDGVRCWLPAPAAVPDWKPDGVWLLPYFDAYVVGGHPRAQLFPGAAKDRALSSTGQAGARPVLLVDGTVGGIWHQRRSGRTLAITVEVFGQLTAAQHRLLGDQAERLSHFLGCAQRTTLGRVEARSHL